jgi:error-prone DNA polymerase
VLNPDINRSSAKCIIENGALRLGFLNVLSVGGASATAIEEGRKKQGAFKNIGEFLERTGVLEETSLNMADAGAFDSLEPNRRKVKWEIGLRYRPINSQLALPLPVEQDMVELDMPSDWESMKEEYNVLSLFPAGHIMAKLRPRFKGNLCCSKDLARQTDGAEVTAAGLVIRRQRPLGKAVFITLEDEFGHIPLTIFPQVYERYKHKFKEPFLMIKGNVSRREGTLNIIVSQVKPFTALDKTPPAKNWG